MGAAGGGQHRSASPPTTPARSHLRSLPSLHQAPGRRQRPAGSISRQACGCMHRAGTGAASVGGLASSISSRTETGAAPRHTVPAGTGCCASAPAAISHVLLAPPSPSSFLSNATGSVICKQPPRFAQHRSRVAVPSESSCTPPSTSLGLLKVQRHEARMLYQHGSQRHCRRLAAAHFPRRATSWQQGQQGRQPHAQLTFPLSRHSRSSGSGEDQR